MDAITQFEFDSALLKATIKHLRKFFLIMDEWFIVHPGDVSPDRVPRHERNCMCRAMNLKFWHDPAKGAICLYVTVHNVQLAYRDFDLANPTYLDDIVNFIQGLK